MKRCGHFEVMAANAAVSSDAGAEPAESGRVERPKETARGDMLYRQLGRTGEEVSVIGLGGHHIGRQKEEKESIAIIHAAIDAGVTFMDNCWDYHDGGSEVRMGKALRGGYRKKVFLMTKIDGRTRQAAAEQLDQSLKRLQTDVIDLLQTPTGSLPRTGHCGRCWPPRKRGRCASLVSLVTRTRSSTCGCWR
jgi:hypothetical protein